MIIIEGLDEFYRAIKSDALANIKFYCICDKWYAVDIEELTKCNYFKTSTRVELPITQSLIDSFPSPRQPVDYVTRKLLKELPVIMFEDPGFDGTYFRADGRHRIQGALKLGLKSVPAVFIPRRIWGLFIIGGVVNPDINIHIATDEKIWANVVPFSWDRPPNAGPTPDGFHYEPMFVLNQPEQVEADKRKAAQKEYEDAVRTLKSSNSGIMFLMKPRKKVEPAKTEQQKINMFVSNAGISRYL